MSASSLPIVKAARGPTSDTTTSTVPPSVPLSLASAHEINATLRHSYFSHPENPMPDPRIQPDKVTYAHAACQTKALSVGE